MAFKFTPQDIPDIVLIEPEIFADERGFFLEVIKKSVFFEQGVEGNIVQVNHSKSAANVLRGLHYQLNPHGQGKIVSVIAGEIFDVAVDIRRGSPTFGKWVSARLSAVNKHLLYIPIGFAHGFCVLSDNAEIIYYCSEEYSLKHERGVLWNDPALDIKWPIADPTVSDKDKAWPALAEADNNFIFDKQ